MQQDDLKKDFFAFLGLPIAFDLDPEALEDNYRTLQKHLHPDKFSMSTEQEKRMAVQLTAHLNEAQATLSNPMRRGRYLLVMQGIDTNEETDTVMPAVFLMEQIEIREQLEELDSVDDPWARLDALAEMIGKKIKDRVQGLSKAFAAKDFQGARGIVREMQFLHKIQDEIEQSEDRLS
ncbi:MAG TPA: Fe-S protein assembly co-chaperone HscB [Acidiferrobacteraceae bacterium]|jgi:molecular chaperone HscB|nr:Fe-S protein assembly co-chaperone HscB [Acidiferrobacteraceae bacterium]HEX20252.1 Fe-S protein assembly co-chaperone HscB [Acidiferrobacteraceae bacterium]